MNDPDSVAGTFLEPFAAPKSQRVAAFSFRSQAPLFDLAPFRLVAVPTDPRVELQARGPDGKTSMTATAELASA